MLYFAGMIQFALAAAVTVALDLVVSACLSQAGVVLADPVTLSVAVAALTLSAVGTGISAYQGQQNLENSRRMRNAQQGLEAERRTQLSNEAAAREAARQRAATAGSRVGRGSLVAGVGALGFGSGTTSPGVGSGSLFGN